jgi:diguanylate cyclase (GGDEF)-like protein
LQPKTYLKTFDSHHAMTDDLKHTAKHEDAYLSISTILDSIDAVVYVSDMETYELIFINQYGLAEWGEPQGRPCWQVLQSGQMGPCDFCTNKLLVDQHGNPTGVHVWDFKNTVNDRWYQCRDQAIPWPDGRLVRLEIATDITDRIRIEHEIKAAKELAEELAHTDDLTGIRNRRALFENSLQIINLAKRFNHEVSIIMLDIDHFKKVNDRFGHPVGDQVLQELTQAIQNCIREVDIFGRLGGEEFALVLPETGEVEAVEVAEKIRTTLANTIYDGGHTPFSITCSFGIATYAKGNGTFEEILAQADLALYQAKENGRNRVERYSQISTPDNP